MKDILESSDSFTAHATIGAGYYMMQTAQEEFDKKDSKNNIERMIDSATGYDLDRLNKHIAYLCMCLDDIIIAKKYIEADYSMDEKMKELLLSKVLK